jgi:AcrR family transcriptional regulator
MARRRGAVATGSKEVAVPRREQLLGIAGQMFSRQSFAGTGVDEIGEAAGVSGPALYRYFANKQAILDALVVEAMERLLRSAQAVAQPEGDPGAWLDALIQVRLDFAFGPDRYSFVIIRDENDNISRAALRKVAAMEERYLADWLRIMTTLRPAAPTNTIRFAIRAAHVFMGYVALEERIDDLDEMRVHIAAMTRAALFA